MEGGEKREKRKVKHVTRSISAQLKNGVSTVSN